MMDEDKKYRDYCLTINNYSETEYQSVIDQSCTYLIVGKEMGESGTPHLQIYMCFKNPRSYKSIKKAFPRAHIEERKGTHKTASEYCKKEGKYVEFGTLPSQGKRSDLEEVRDIVRTTGSMRQVVDHCKSYQSVRMAEVMMKYYEPARKWKPKVKWYFGETGSGKSYQARIDFSGQDYYVCMSEGKWFEGYDAHEYVIVDDIRTDFMKYKTLLQFLDRYEFRVETKGGSRQFLAKEIIITCPLHPKELYRDVDEDNRQLLRRIDEIWWFKLGEPAMRDCIHMKFLQSLYAPAGEERSDDRRSRVAAGDSEGGRMPREGYCTERGI